MIMTLRASIVRLGLAAAPALAAQDLDRERRLANRIVDSLGP